MPTKTKRKKTAERKCAYCLEPFEKVAISGQTAVGKQQEMIYFTVCEPCYTKMRNTRGDSAKMMNNRRLFWEKVKKNAAKLAS